MTESMKYKKYIGTKDFYKRVIMIAIPIMVQNFITNFVSMLDNIMVGQIGTEQMSGVAIVNQLIFVFNISMFGAVSGAGIFGAQFYGRGDNEGVRYAFRYKVYASIILTLAAISLFLLSGRSLISLYLHEGSDVGDLELTLEYAWQYIRIIVIGLLPSAICQVYASTLRECGRTLPPMIAGIIAVAVNLMFNYVLIFGKFNAPALGANGAAIATCIARFVECIVLVVWTHANKIKCPYFVNALKSFKIPVRLAAEMLKKGLPLMLNEFFWSVGIAVIAQCYAYRGLSVLAAQNISSTMVNLFNIVFITFGSSVSIIIGQLLGAGEIERAKREDRWLIVFAVIVCTIVAAVMSCFAGVFPQIYKTEQEVMSYATQFILISAAIMPVNAFTNAVYFTLRSGGRTGVTFLFDSVYSWVIVIPVAYILSRYTGLPVVAVYAVIQCMDIIKGAVGFVLIKKGIWINNLTDENIAS